jgi:nucleoside-diphosphate-sugar epimerase
MAKVMVTGAGGYIGTQLVKDLIEKGNEVTAVDRFFFGKETLRELLESKKLNVLKKDIRDLDEKDFKNHTVVCDLACLSNDPAGEINPQLTYDINRGGRIHVAKMAKLAGVNKYVISSSCSVYGTGDDLKLTEDSATNPISVYAKSTLEAEQENIGISDSNFSVTALRNATVFGLSNRMRFDLVVNLMTLTAYTRNRIIIMGGGLQWRPLVHVSDVSAAFINIVERTDSVANGEVFNIGLDNYQIKSLAHLIVNELDIPIEIDMAPDDVDKRDYNVDFGKAKKILGFHGKKSVTDGVREIYTALKNNSVDTGIKTNTVQWYRSIIDAKKLLDEIMLNSRVI